MEWNWEAVAGFVSAGILVVAGVVAWWQVRAARKSTDTQLVVGLYERFYTPETMEVLRSLYRTEPKDVQDLPRYKMDKI
jgi:hypothetical protein